LRLFDLISTSTAGAATIAASKATTETASGTTAESTAESTTNASANTAGRTTAKTTETTGGSTAETTETRWTAEAENASQTTSITSAEATTQTTKTTAITTLNGLSLNSSGHLGLDLLLDGQNLLSDNSLRSDDLAHLLDDGLGDGVHESVSLVRGLSLSEATLTTLVLVLDVHTGR